MLLNVSHNCVTKYVFVTIFGIFTNNIILPTSKQKNDTLRLFNPLTGNYTINLVDTL